MVFRWIPVGELLRPLFQPFILWQSRLNAMQYGTAHIGIRDCNAHAGNKNLPGLPDLERLTGALKIIIEKWIYGNSRYHSPAHSEMQKKRKLSMFLNQVFRKTNFGKQRFGGLRLFFKKRMTFEFRQTRIDGNQRFAASIRPLCFFCFCHRTKINSFWRLRLYRSRVSSGFLVLLI